MVKLSNLENIGQFVWANQVPENTIGNKNLANQHKA